MSKTRKALVNDEWIVVVLGFIVLALSVLFPNTMNSLKIPGILASQSAGALGSLEGWLGTSLHLCFCAGFALFGTGIDRKTVQGNILFIPGNMLADSCFAGVGHDSVLQEIRS